MDKRDLTAAQKIVLFALATFADYWDGTNAHPGDDLLAEMCGYTPTAVGTAVRRGRELGLIERTRPANRKGGKAAIYRLVFSSTAVGVKTSVYPNGDEVFTPTATTFLPQRPLGSPTQVPTHSPRGLRKPGTSPRDRTDDDPTPNPLTGNSNSEPAKLADGWVRGPFGPRCRKHLDDRKPPDCRSCGDARKADEAAAEADETRRTAERRAIRRGIDDCPDCDAFGRLDDLTDCPKHPNFRDRRAS